jgi:glycosyltransferase involved in cell wall biosynthesis
MRTLGPSFATQIRGDDNRRGGRVGEKARDGQAGEGTEDASPIAIAFVGAFGLEGDGPENPAYSAAGHLLQERILHGLESAGADISAVFSVRTVPSYPRQRLLFGPGEQDVGGRYRARLLPFVNLGPVKTLTTSVTLVPELVRWAWRNRRRPRAVLLYNVNIPPGIVGLLASRLTGTRIFAIVADIQVPGSGFYADSLLRRMDYGLQTRTLPLLDGLIVLTRRMASDFAPGTPWLLMEGGVPEDAVAAPLPDAKDADAPVVFMYSGSLTDLKGIPLLLAGFERARGEHLRLWIAGGGPLQAEVEAAAARDGRIRFLGSLPHAEVLRAYAGVDVLVNPHSTRHVTARYLFPSKLLEYLAMGRPVITTCSTPEVREEYGDVAYVMAEEDPAELAALFERVGAMTPAERRERGALCRARVAEGKTWPRQGRRMLDFIGGIVRGGRAARVKDERNMDRGAVRARDFLQGT